MDTARVVEVWVPGPARVGSGYMLSERLVLTAYHVVEGLAPGARAEIRPLGNAPQGPWMRAAPCWPPGPVDLDATPEQDAALLVIDPPDGSPPEGTGPPIGTVRFGQLSGTDRVPCTGLGFPTAERRPARRRDTMPVRGHVDSLQGRKSPMLTVHVDTGIVPRRRPGAAGPTSGWAGASGAALFCGELLVAVLATDRDVADNASVLGAVPVAALADLPGFRETLAAYGVDLRFEHASPSAEALAAYVDAAGRAANEHPYASVLPGRTPPLAAVYLRQYLRRRNTRIEDPLEAPARVESDLLQAGEVLGDPPACVVLSGPGGGKSSLLRTRLAHGVRAWQDGRAEHLLPVLVRAEALAEAPTFVEALTTAATAELGLTGQLPLGFFAAPPAPGRQWLILVDGMDEIADPAAQRRVLRMLETSTTGRHNPLYRFVIATRPLPDGLLDLLGEAVPQYELQPFAPEELERAVRGWFRAAGLDDPDGDARRFVQTLEVGRLAAVARVPLMTAMLCQVRARAHRRAPETAWHLPTSRGRIYRDFITLLAKQPPATAPGARYPGLTRYGPRVLQQAERVLTELDDVLGHLAAERHADNALPTLAIVQTAHAKRPTGVRDEDWHAFLDTALRRTGLLIPRSGDLVFLHQTLLEHLAADHAVRETGSLVLERVFGPDGPSGNGRSIPWTWPRKTVVPPRGDPSYLGFVIDAAHDHGLPVDIPLRRLASRGGLPAGQFIAQLADLGTGIPDDVRKATGNVLEHLALGAARNDEDRFDAAHTLVQLGDPRGTDLLHTLAHDTTYFGLGRIVTAIELHRAGDPRGIDILHTLACGTTVDPRGTGILHTLARGTTVTESLRGSAAAALARLGDRRAIALLHSLACDIAADGGDRVQAATALAELGDPRGASLLHALARDTTAHASGRSVRDVHVATRDAEALRRVQAAEALVRLGDPRGTALLQELADDTTFGELHRLRAANALTKRGDPRAFAAILALARYNKASPISPVTVARWRAQLGDPRALALLHELAHDTTLSRRERRDAAFGLVSESDPHALSRARTDGGGT